MVWRNRSGKLGENESENMHSRCAKSYKYRFKRVSPVTAIDIPH